MGVASGEITIGHYEIRCPIQGFEQFRRSLVEQVLEEQGGADSGQINCQAITWAEAQESLKMLERYIGLTGKKSQYTAHIPTAREARLEGERPIDHPDRHIDVLAEQGERIGSAGKDVGVVRSGSKSPASKIDTCAPVRIPVVSPAAEVELGVAAGGQGKRRAELRITLDRAPQKVERQGVLLPIEGEQVREGTQVQIVGTEIVRRPFGR